jgi:hypothetical protein
MIPSLLVSYSPPVESDDGWNMAVVPWLFSVVAWPICICTKPKDHDNDPPERYSVGTISDSWQLRQLFDYDGWPDPELNQLPRPVALSLTTLKWEMARKVQELGKEPPYFSYWWNYLSVSELIGEMRSTVCWR